MTRLATYVVNGTTLTVDMKPPLAEAQRLVTADPLTRGIVLTPIRGFGSYSANTASGSTDTGSGHVDFNAEGMTDAQAARCVLYLRRVGFLAYFRRRSWWSSWLARWRTPGWQKHIHCLLVGSSDLSATAKAQVTEWVAGGDGLVGPEKDNGDRTVVGRTWAAYLAIKNAVVNTAQATLAAPKVKKMQAALRLKPVDGSWGPVTERQAWLTKTAAMQGRAFFAKRPVGERKAIQAHVGTTQDGIWGPATQAALKATVKAIQRDALGVGMDGVWGPVTDRAYYALRRRAYRP